MQMLLTSPHRRKNISSSRVDHIQRSHFKTPQTLKSDRDALHEAHRFIRTTADDADGSWSAQLARRYYSRLFKEYCIADLSRYKESKLGLRWRTKDEVSWWHWFTRQLLGEQAGIWDHLAGSAHVTRFFSNCNHIPYLRMAAAAGGRLITRGPSPGLQQQLHICLV